MIDISRTKDRNMVKVLPPNGKTHLLAPGEPLLLNMQSFLTNTKSRDTTSAEGAVGASGC
jgi:hypothetical protein